MGLDTDIAALPGGEQLAAFVRAVQGGGFVDEAGAALTSTLSQSGEAAGAVQAAVARLEQSFTGAPATAFADLMAEFGQQSRVFQQSGTALAGSLASVGPAFGQLRLAVETIATNLLFQVGQVHIARAGVTAGMDADITALVSQATAAAEASVMQFELVLGQANGTITAELPAFGRTFSSLPVVGDSTGFDVGLHIQAPMAPLAEMHVPEQMAGSPPVELTTRTPLQDPNMPPIRVDVPSQPPPSQPPPAGAGSSSGVDGWIDQATRILVANGVPAAQLDHQVLATIIAHESNGDPGAVNNWDSNAAAGTPSIGLMQTIGPTFQAYALPGHTDIYNPVDNIIAGTRYALARYGSLDNVPGILSVRSGQAYVGY